MKKKNEALARMGFRRIGGSYQLRITSAEDIRNVLDLDEALWAMTSVQIDFLDVDRKFLEYLDDDLNQRIRADEVKRAVRWLLEMLRDYSGINAASDVLMLDAINTASEEGAGLHAAAKVILENLNLASADRLTLDQIDDKDGFIAFARQNGDGIIPPDAVDDPAVSQLINSIMAAVGSVNDLSGSAGVNTELVDKYVAAIQEWQAWYGKAKDAVPALLPWDRDTIAIVGAIDALRSRIDDFFINCAALRFVADSPERLCNQRAGADRLDPQSVQHFLEKVVIAEPNPESRLDLRGAINPLYQSQADALDQALQKTGKVTDGVLTAAAWLDLKATIAPFEEWYTGKPGVSFENRSEEELAGDVDGEALKRLREYIEVDNEAAGKIKFRDELRKLVLYQKYMLLFLNNYVSLTDLFNPQVPSLLQAGKLIMDGRHFTLATYVKNITEHKDIAKTSNICIVYLSITSGRPDALRSMTLAVAITSGHMRNLFVGKCGVFFTDNGDTWDAKVIDFIQQPVSISEAMTIPFLRLGEFIGRQADKFFSAQSADAQKALETNIAAGAQQIATQPAAKPQTPAVSGSMMLMGGGIGIAAIGSSIALLAQALHNISIWTVLAIFFGVILIFGGPVVAVSLVKLFRRNVARFLEAGSCAVNRSMRLTRRMGAIFTFAPKLPPADLISKDLVKLFHPSGVRERVKLLIFLIVLLAIVAGGAYGGYRYYRSRQDAAAAAVEETRNENPAVPTDQPASPDRPGTLPPPAADSPLPSA